MTSTSRTAHAEPLDASTVPSLPETVSSPTYDRAALRTGVEHIGVGSFHRAHQAVHSDELTRRGETGWGLTGVGLHSRAIGEVLTAQGGLYLVVRSPEADATRVVGPLVRCLYRPDDPAAVLAALTAPSTRLVTLTITGTGHRIDPHTREFDPGGPHHLPDLAVAGWLRYLRGEDYGGEDFPVEGPRQDLIPRAQRSGDDAGPLLTESLSGPLREDPRFVQPVTEALQALGRQGAREVVGEHLARPGADS